MNATHLLWLIALLPFLGAAVNGLLGPRVPRSVTTTVAILAPGLSLVLALAAIWRYATTLAPQAIQQVAYSWTLPPFKIDFAFLLDPLSAVMLFVVTFVGFFIHLYSVGYMEHEEGYQRYFAYLNLFMGAMLLLILGNNYLIMFMGWEGVGLCSYLLIGYYYDQSFPPQAGRKAFIVNRIGDFAFLIGMFAIFSHFGTFNYRDIFASVVAHPAAVQGHYLLGMTFVTFVTLCLFIGAMGKSAQIPLYVWLPDAMAGPTPVSALIHAATMVTAGVYMVVRSNALYQLAPGTSELIAIVGAITALFAATIAIAQTDIKKVLAYSTISQLGYMFLGAGVGAYSAAIFHLGTHAFFKALLFLGSGSVIHAMSGEQDMRRMGGLRKAVPITYWTFLIATLAISGVPGFSGFFSKDEILGAAYQDHKLLWCIGVFTAGLTALYMFRLFYMTFHGSFRGNDEEKHHLHESPAVMTIPLIVLAAGAFGAGWIGLPRLGDWDHNVFDHFLAPIAAHLSTAGAEHHGSVAIELLLMAFSTILGLLGILIAWRYYAGEQNLAGGEAWAQRFPRIHRILVNKYYVDEAYSRFVVKPLARIARFLWKGIDSIVIDGSVHVPAFFAELTGDVTRFSTTGNLRNYALYFFVGVLLLFWWMVS